MTMLVPTYDKFIDPLLRFLATHPNGTLARDAHEAVAGMLGLSEAAKQELLPSGTQLVYKNRAGWAHDRLKRAGLSSSPRRGFWQLTPAGVDFANAHPNPLEQVEIDRIAGDFNTVRLRDDSPVHPTYKNNVVRESSVSVTDIASPDDRLGEAILEIRSSVTREILEVLQRVSPAFFETVVLDLLHRLGYGASRNDLQRVGGSGDAGIDGVISLDKLGLEKVYVQAKRWQSNVGRPEIQAFYGALAGQRANKGVFITTSCYTPAALDFARSVERIVLIDGERLANLMVDNEVGVNSRLLRVPRFDSDYFEEEQS